MSENEFPPIPENDKKASVIVVVGKRGLGKSRLTKDLILPEGNRTIVVDVMDEYAPLPIVYTTQELADYVADKKVFKVRIRTGDPDDMADICFLAYALGRCTLIIEESQVFVPAGGSKPSPFFMNVVNRGRHRAVSLVLVAQRYGAIHIAARALWDVIYAFRQTEAADTRQLRDASGYDLVELETLPPGRYYKITTTSEIIDGRDFS